jgi:hypothetical protein
MACDWDNPFMDVPADVQAQIDRLITSGRAVIGTVKPSQNFTPVASKPAAPARPVHKASPGLGRTGGWQPF